MRQRLSQITTSPGFHCDGTGIFPGSHVREARRAEAAPFVLAVENFVDADRVNVDRFAAGLRMRSDNWMNDRIRRNFASLVREARELSLA